MHMFSMPQLRAAQYLVPSRPRCHYYPGAVSLQLPGTFLAFGAPFHMSFFYTCGLTVRIKLRKQMRRSKQALIAWCHQALQGLYQSMPLLLWMMVGSQQCRFCRIRATLWYSSWPLSRRCCANATRGTIITRVFRTSWPSNACRPAHSISSSPFFSRAPLGERAAVHTARIACRFKAVCFSPPTNQPSRVRRLCVDTSHGSAGAPLVADPALAGTKHGLLSPLKRHKSQAIRPGCVV